MKRVILVFVTLLLYSSLVSADSGLIKVKSPHSASHTLDRFEEAVRSTGMAIFARVNHAKGAEKVNLELPPTELLIFGNPKVGTLLMQSNQSVGLDLPLKVLAWKGNDGVVWLAYNDPGYMVTRHGITDKSAVVEKMRATLQKLCEIATEK
jgi:uncharacterized protein (DUF302 family)